MQITKLIQNHTYSGLVVVLLVALIAVFDNKPNPKLEQRVSDLENRVDLIEENLTRTDTIDAPDKGLNYRENWRQLREGMSQDQVQELLGRPDRIDGGRNAIWHYSVLGRVHFSRGRVDRWSEPI